MDARIEKLNQLIDRHFHYWKEIFKDEETGEEYPVERRELLDPNLSEEELKLMEEIAKDMTKLSDEELERFHALSLFDSRMEELTRIELVRHGKEDYAEFIEDMPTLIDFCNKGNRWAAYALYQKYNKGDEAQGIFINSMLARKYYDLAGDIPYKEEWKEKEEP